MKIPIYEDKDISLEGTVLAILKPLNNEGDFQVLEVGKGFVPSTTGISVVIDEKYVMQLHKFKLSMDSMLQPELTLKDEETFEEPKESQLAQRERELLAELAKIQELLNKEEQ